MEKVRDLKQQLISSLTDKERLLLVMLLEKVHGRFSPKLLPSMYLAKCETPTFFGFLHKQLFGEWLYNGHTSVLRVMQEVPRIKELLKQVPITAEFVERFSANLPISLLMPEDFRLSNEVMQNVEVTTHAWQRFCERFQPRASEPDHVALCMRASFRRAEPVSLGVYHTVRRVIRSGHNETEYLLDAILKCRFVIVVRDEKSVVATVEIPY